MNMCPSIWKGIFDYYQKKKDAENTKQMNYMSSSYPKTSTINILLYFLLVFSACLFTVTFICVWGGVKRDDAIAVFSFDLEQIHIQLCILLFT